MSTQPVADPADPGSKFRIHTSFGQYTGQIGKVRNKDYDNQTGCDGSGGKDGDDSKEGETGEETEPVVSTWKPTEKPSAMKKASSTKVAPSVNPIEQIATIKEPIERPTVEPTSSDVIKISSFFATPSAILSKWKPTIVGPTFTKNTKPVVKPAKTRVSSTLTLAANPPPITVTVTLTPTLGGEDYESQKPTGAVINKPIRTGTDEPISITVDEPTGTIINEPSQALPTKPAMPTKPSDGTPKAQYWQ